MSKKFKINKLIRDHLPKVMRDRGIKVHEKIMDDEEYILRLKDKLLEEAEEIHRAVSKEELLEELADGLEVIMALAKANGLTIKQLDERRREKCNVKGGFDRKIYCSHVEIEEINEAIFEYLQEPEKYPEIQNEYTSSKCLFCQFAKGKREVGVIERFDHCFAIFDQFPVSKGHALIIPYEHTENWFTASDLVKKDILKALKHMKMLLDDQFGPAGYNIGANCGEVAGQTIMHLHVHLIPRYDGDMDDPKGGVRGVIPEKQKY